MPEFHLLFGLTLAPAAVLFFFSSMVKILREYERGVIFRLGKKARSVFNPGGDGLGPGLLLLLPFVGKMVKVGLRPVAMDVPPQDVITRDNVFIKRCALIYSRRLHPKSAPCHCYYDRYATSQMA